LEGFEIPGTKLMLWDCWGFSGNDFDKVLLNEISDGHLKSGMELNSGIRKDCEKYKRYPGAADKMNNVIL
jgi:hypothetical protein